MHRLRLLTISVIAAAVLAAPVFAASTVTLLPEQVRGSVAGTQAVGNGVTGVITMRLVSSTWTTLTGPNSVTVTVTIDRSFDSGATWQNAGITVWQSPGVNPKSGLLPDAGINLDGVGSIWRVTIVPSANFSYGISATF